MTSGNRIRSGGMEYEAVWVRCRVAASFKPEEAVVSLRDNELNQPLDFFVDANNVRPEGLVRGEQVDGEVKALLLDRKDGTVLIQVPGEPVSYGPKITVSMDAIADPAPLVS